MASVNLDELANAAAIVDDGFRRLLEQHGLRAEA